MRIFLIDGQSYIYRAFYAVRELSNASGFPTNAIFGFVNMLQRVQDTYDPSHLAIIFDAPGKNFRHARYGDYKANRQSMPDALRQQIPRIKEVVGAYRIPAVELAGYEADDILATLASRWDQDGAEIVLVSGDKDLMQLVSERVTMLDTMKNQTIGIEEVRAKFGVEPGRVVEVQALMGDPTDNIPGIPGVGHKTAMKLIAEWHDLENVLSHSDAIKGKLGHKIRDNIELARLSKELATLCRGVPVEVELDSLAREEPDVERLRELFSEFEFRRFLADLDISWEFSVDDEEAKAGRYEIVRTAEQLQHVLSQIRAAKTYCLDTETTALNPLDAELVGVALSVHEEQAWYLPVAHTAEGAESQLPRQTVLAALRSLFEDESLSLVGQNLKYDVMVLAKYGLWPGCLAGDTMLASYLLDPATRHNLNDLAWEHLHYSMTSYEEVTDGAKKGFAEVAVEDAASYSGEDADITLRLAQRLFPRLHDEGMGELFSEVEVPLALVLARMELNGILIDPNFLAGLSTEFSHHRRRLEHEIYDMAGEEFNIASPQQLQRILFEKLGLPRGKKTKTGSSTDSSVLEGLSERYPLPAKILSYRGFAKLQSTYVDALPKLIHPTSGRIHTSFNQTVTATGRLSSSNPNLQNIPIRSQEGRRIRAAFVPEPGHVFVSADYSQIELRLLAHLSHDPVLVESFRRGQDVHARTATEIFGVDTVTADQRRQAKTINFGIIYGMGAHRLGRSLGIPFKTAQGYIDQYFARYHGIKGYMDGVLDTARERGYVTTLQGRRRYVPDLHSNNRQVVSAAERVAINTPIQGTAADLIKIAMVVIDRRLRQQGFGTRMLLQVHDELLFEVLEEEIQTLIPLVREIMEGVTTLEVPLEVEIGQGSSWADAH
jgi:DNA polymerase-1